MSNWVEADEVSAAFVSLDETGRVQPVTGDDWAKTILTPSLGESVPDEVVLLYETARGALLYGYFFYPLYSLGLEQSFRVAEAAAKARLEQDIGLNKLRYADVIDRLHGRGVIDDEGRTWWHFVREMRNYASHPKGQMIGLPGQTVALFGRITERINRLFGN